MRSDKVPMSLTGSFALALQKAEASSLQGGKPCRFRSRLNRGRSSCRSVEPPRRVPEPLGFWLCDWYRQEFLWAAESSSASLLAFDFFQEKPESGKGAVFRQPKIVSRGFCLKSTPFALACVSPGITKVPKRIVVFNSFGHHRDPQKSLTHQA